MLQVANTTPVTLSFKVQPSDADPFARDIWAVVVAPSGSQRDLPAYFVGDDRYAVRANPAEAGTYKLGELREQVNGVEQRLKSDEVDLSQATASEAARQNYVRVDPHDATRFTFADGAAYVPIGSNLPWPNRPEVVDHYRKRFEQFDAAGLNWARIWMCHWGGLNLDWLRPSDGASPQPGHIDARIAARWDRIIELAEEHGVLVQMVLQHHGQYSSQVNPNWNDNPWNAANPGGFLKSASDFFTSERARTLTKQKFRYIVARWGYSPAILAWELFNEVHWVDALRLEHDVSAVAAWHTEMADWIRAFDVFHHPVTTSTDRNQERLCENLDYLQPHLYARNMIAATRHLDGSPESLGKPIFYGEIGDDHLQVSDEAKCLNRGTIPPVWSGLMGESILPPQIWTGDRLIDGGGLKELSAVARFLAETQLAQRQDLRPFSPAIESESVEPQRLSGALNWKHCDNAEITVPTDGSEANELGVIPSHLVSSTARAESGFPNAVTFHVDYPRQVNAHVHLGGAGANGSTATVSLDGTEVGRHTWPAGEGNENTPPTDIAFEVEPGRHTIDIRNESGPDWFEFLNFTTGLDTAALAAVGKRSSHFIALWIWNRDQVNAIDPEGSPDATLLIPDVPAGNWRITWWDTAEGVPHPAAPIEHPGGALRLPTPGIRTHAAVVLEN